MAKCLCPLMSHRVRRWRRLIKHHPGISIPWRCGDLKHAEYQICKRMESQDGASESASESASKSDDILNNLKQFLEEYATKDVITCKACKNTFTAEYSLKRHHERSHECRHWLSASEEEKKVTPSLPMLELVETLFDRAIKGDKDIQCKFCKSVFSSIGNLHKHFIRSAVCNCLAFNEFKRLVCEQ